MQPPFYEAQISCADVEAVAQAFYEISFPHTQWEMTPVAPKAEFKANARATIQLLLESNPTRRRLHVKSCPSQIGRMLADIALQAGPK